MKKNLGTILQYVLFLGLGVGIIYYMLHEQTPEQQQQMINSIKSVRLWLFAPIFVIGFFSHYFRALRWKLLLEPLKIFPSTINITFAVLIGYIANLVLPRAGEVAKCTVLASYEKVPANKMVGTIVAERAFDVLCLIIITLLTCLLQASVIGSYAVEKFHKIVELITKNEVVLTIMITVAVALVFFLIRVYRRHRETKVGHFIKGMSDGVRSILHMQKKWQFIGYTFLIWLMYTLQIYLGFLGLPATDHLTILAALVVLIFGSVGMILTPGGLGAYTWLVAEILHSYNIDPASANAFGYVAWSAQTGILIILGILSLILLPIYNKKIRNAQVRMGSAQDLQ
ncbi:MAG: lysylphosphatidylglycerol synthase transmembrane domain-containing protein [Bacteroidota bacterium]